MVVITTFVIFDIETTGLPRYEKNRTKITELTFLAVSTKDIETAITGQVPLINKLSYLFNPERNIQPDAASLTGLSNEALKNQLTFKNRIPSLNSFLNDLPKPVCLVAHNGNSFDFKLLRSEYKDADAVLPNDLYCVDTIWGFKQIQKNSSLGYEIMATNKSKSDDLLMDSNQINESKSDDLLTDSNQINESKSDDLLTDSNQINESKSDGDWPELNISAEDCDEIDKLVESFSKISPLKDSGNSQITNKANIGSKADKPIRKSTADKQPKMSFTLQALYKRLLNKEAVNAHRSEADCIMLLECIIALKNEFLPYMYNKCQLISKVKPYERY